MERGKKKKKKEYRSFERKKSGELGYTWSLGGEGGEELRK